MKDIYKILVLFVLLSSTYVNVFAQNNTPFSKSATLKHSVSTDPLPPFFNSFAIIYEYEKTSINTIKILIYLTNFA